MDVLTQFGSGGANGRKYLFDTSQQVSLMRNFANVVPSTQRIPGASGGFNAYGSEPLPGEIGTLQVVFWMEYADAAAARAQYDAVQAMADWGLQRLWMQPAALGAHERFCWAAVNSIDANFNVEDMPHRRMRVTVTFHVPDPVWYSFPFEVLYADAGHVADDGLAASGWTATQYIVSAPATVMIDVDGTVGTLPLIHVEATGAFNAFLGQPGLALGDADLVLGGGVSGTVENLRLARVDEDTLRETHAITWRGLLDGLDRLRIDAASEKVVYENSSEGNVSGWPQLERTRASMLRLLPGPNLVEIGGAFTGKVLIRIEYMEQWR